MRAKPTFPCWFLLLFTRVVFAIPTNHTIDDHGPLVQYSGGSSDPDTTGPWDKTMLFNGTVSYLFLTPSGAPASLTLNLSGACHITIFAGSP
jgi:hypothetical protein